MKSLEWTDEWKSEWNDNTRGLWPKVLNSEAGDGRQVSWGNKKENLFGRWVGELSPSKVNKYIKNMTKQQLATVPEQLKPCDKLSRLSKNLRVASLAAPAAALWIGVRYGVSRPRTQLNSTLVVRF